MISSFSNLTALKCGAIRPNSSSGRAPRIRFRIASCFSGCNNRLLAHVWESFVLSSHSLGFYNQRCEANWAMGTMQYEGCLLYTSDAADERSSVDLGGR